jgi:transcriptional regulator with XRE-family HTH domain
MLGISQRHLAKLLDVDPSTIARWEKDEAQPSTRLEARLEGYFNSRFEGNNRLGG